ncbi:uncharacterized protein LOC134289535 [Aedes albopictus]|uniref:Uncharacterized protein n=1 Tax=Aedes albopictus TaxID=7160 RepID=A0ABM2A637_AEDAL
MAITFAAKDDGRAEPWKCGLVEEFLRQLHPVQPTEPTTEKLIVESVRRSLPFEPVSGVNFRRTVCERDWEENHCVGQFEGRKPKIKATVLCLEKRSLSSEGLLMDSGESEERKVDRIGRNGDDRTAPFDGPHPAIGRCWTAKGGRGGAGVAGLQWK